MAYVKKLFQENFLEYASYVIKDRAIPDIEDGLKPVQRRILHSLFEMDDGKFHKVANVVGHCMKYHPHGDASIFSALVLLANKEMFIEKQGNFGNVLTGDEASAARYIECRLLPLAKQVLYNPAITAYQDSYDSRNREPVVFPAKIPTVLIQGAEGIAVGMATRILPHNFQEVLEAVIAELKGQSFELYPEFPGGGMIDVSAYEDGLGKVLVRVKPDTRDPKRIVIREIPYGTTTEDLIASIEGAARKNKIKIASINDYTAEHVEIEIRLPRNVHTQDVVDALYAFTDCEQSISVNLLVIKNGLPTICTVTEVVRYHAKGLLDILKAELKIEEGNLKDKIHARTLERIFIEERIYKRIETEKTKRGVVSAVLDGFTPFLKEIKRPVTEEDVEGLLKIPIRRISLYDINKAQKEMEEMEARLKQIRYHLRNLTEYAIGFLEGIIEKEGHWFGRKTEIISFTKVDVREAASRNLKLSYDPETGYLGYGVRTGQGLFDVSSYDRILIIRKGGVYSVVDAPEKLFVDKGMLFCGHTDKEMMEQRVFTVLYRNNKTGYPHLKRCKIEKYILGKTYFLIPENGTVVKLTTRVDVAIRVTYKPKPRVKILEEDYPIKDFLVKGAKAAGVRLATRELRSGRFLVLKNGSGSNGKSSRKKS